MLAHRLLVIGSVLAALTFLGSPLAFACSQTNNGYPAYWMSATATVSGTSGSTSTGYASYSGWLNPLTICQGDDKLVVYFVSEYDEWTHEENINSNVSHNFAAGDTGTYVQSSTEANGCFDQEVGVEAYLGGRCLETPSQATPTLVTQITRIPAFLLHLSVSFASSLIHSIVHLEHQPSMGVALESSQFR
jgi:hypothetical protein